MTREAHFLRGATPLRPELRPRGEWTNGQLPLDTFWGCPLPPAPLPDSSTDLRRRPPGSLASAAIRVPQGPARRAGLAFSELTLPSLAEKGDRTPEPVGQSTGPSPKCKTPSNMLLSHLHSPPPLLHPRRYLLPFLKGQRMGKYGNELEAIRIFGG